MSDLYRAGASRLHEAVSTLVTALAVGLGFCSPGAAAQQGTTADKPTPNSTPAVEARSDLQNGADTLLDDIVVTATKQSRAQLNQSVPISITAFNANQLETLKVKDIMAIASTIPSVSFEQTTARSTANFSIRGLGVNSSRVSTSPSVGVFVNGVYIGVNSGLSFDAFDLEGIEVLRGPQGTLFGRNVTGGAVLLNYQRPKAQRDLFVRARVESGLDYNFALAGGGPLTDTISARVAMFYDDDRGYFNAPLLSDRKFGLSKSFSIRPSVRYKSGAGTDITLFTEYGRVSGDGAVSFAPEYAGGTSTTPGTLPAPGFRYSDILVQERGDTFIEWYAATVDAHQDIGFGADASITSVTGYRHLQNYARADLDGTPRTVANATFVTPQHQFSEELRYNGGFGRGTVTTGVYFFHQLAAQYTRQNAINSSQGGRLDEKVLGVFGQLDYKLTDKLTLQAGGRYTHEKKNVQVASLASENPLVQQAGTFGVPGSCLIGDRNGPARCTFTFSQNAAFSNFSPKLSMQYQLAQRVLLYGTAQKAYRSGGFNTSQNARFQQAPYNPEKQNAYEIGFKSDLFDKKTRLNGVAYLTNIKGLQRDVVQFDPVTLSSAQQSLNTADATIKGFELELVQQLMPSVVLTGSVGYTNAHYDKILFDITQDPASVGGPAVTSFDYQQRLPRVLPWTYGLSLNANHDFSAGRAAARIGWNHRDRSYFSDYNFGRRDGADPKLPAANLLDLTLSFDLKASALSFSLYGRNLMNELTLGNFTALSYPNIKGCACYANKGRVLGAEVSAKF
jgi:iron complex outermembrane recepter protein